MTALPRLAPLALVLMLAGCGASAPLRYHALSANGGDALAQGSAAVLVEVLPVAVPERVNREEIVLTAPGGQLDVRSGERWAAPLADEMRQMVDDALWRRLRAADVYAAPAGPASGGLPQYRLAVRMERLDAAVGRTALAEATWTVRRLPQGQPTICRAGASEALAGPDTAAAVAGLSKAAARVADAVAASLERLNAGAANACGN